ncbi:uncharacterized protein [Watersipora subatra]|uniref:uncharacterized protein isoform X2 n=1 Tax=Watersipora subatra TaxID=2589382 RepID=UPI00355B05DF
MELKSNTSTTESDGSIFYTVYDIPITYAYFSLNVVMIVIHIGIIALNSCMIAAIRRTRKIGDPSGHCLIGLSAAYIWHGLMMIYTGIYGLAQMQQLHECLIRFGLVHSSFVMISWTNCMLTMDRYLQIEFPFWYKKHMHIRTIWIANCITAALAILYGASTLMFNWYIPQEGNRENICEYFHILPALHLQLFYVLTFVGFPFLARKHKLDADHLARTTPAKQAARENKHKWRPVKIVLTICTVYVVCWGVPAVYGFLLTLGKQYPVMEQAYLSTMAALIMVPSLSAIINPCMFTLHKEVKRKFLEIIKCENKQRNDFESSFVSERGMSGISSKRLHILPQLLSSHKNKGSITEATEANNNVNARSESSGKKCRHLPKLHSCESIAGSPCTVISFELELTSDSIVHRPLEEVSVDIFSKEPLEEVAVDNFSKEQVCLEISSERVCEKMGLDKPTAKSQDEIGLEITSQEPSQNVSLDNPTKGSLEEISLDNLARELQEKPFLTDTVEKTLENNFDTVSKNLSSPTSSNILQTDTETQHYQAETFNSISDTTAPNLEQINPAQDLSNIELLQSNSKELPATLDVLANTLILEDDSQT